MSDRDEVWVGFERAKGDQGASKKRVGGKRVRFPCMLSAYIPYKSSVVAVVYTGP